MADSDITRSAARARRDRTIQERFLDFHSRNPQVYYLLVRFSYELKRRGYEHCGISLVWERMRWEVAMTTNDPDGFKLNNDWRSRYARLLMEQEPELDGFFRTRQLTAV